MLGAAIRAFSAERENKKFVSAASLHEEKEGERESWYIVHTNIVCIYILVREQLRERERERNANNFLPDYILGRVRPGNIVRRDILIAVT